MANPTAPADTRMMGIVHRALRRDLARAELALTAEDGPADRQRVAIAEHLTWMVGFIRAHHASEDHGLYPVVRERRPDAAPLLDRMDRDHQAIDPALAAVEVASAAYGSSADDSARRDLVAALRRLHDVLTPHLRVEEDEMMPIVAATITDDEWRAIEHEHNLAGTSFRQLGLEGHWLIDGVTAEDRATVPALPRAFLLVGLARSYRRRQERCWRPRPTKHAVQQHGVVEVTVDAPIDAVGKVLHDVTSQGAWSHECVETEWMGAATSAELGARLRGRNAQGLVRWGRTCEIVTARPDELAWRTVPTALFPDSTVWTINLTSVDAGTTRIEQRFDVVRGPKVLSFLYSFVVPAHCDRSAAGRADLERLGALAASNHSAAAAAPATNAPADDARSPSSSAPRTIATAG
jgi:hemerythrin-like domain-containing protein